MRKSERERESESLEFFSSKDNYLPLFQAVSELMLLVGCLVYLHPDFLLRKTS